MVVLDMDGTIYGRQFAGGISPRVRRAIAAVQESGTPVTVATGRIFDFVRGVAPKLGLTLPVITAQGAVIGDPVSGEVLYEALIEQEAAQSVAAWADGEERTTVFYLNGAGGRTRMVQNAPDTANGRTGWEGWDSATYDHWFGSPREMHGRLAEVVSEPGIRPLKFITVNDHTREPDQTAALQQRFGDGVHMSRSHQYLVEGTAPEANKGMDSCGWQRGSVLPGNGSWPSATTKTISRCCGRQVWRCAWARPLRSCRLRLIGWRRRWRRMALR